MMKTMLKSVICILMVVAMASSLVTLTPSVEASGYMAVTSETKSLTSIRLSWKSKKVDRYKIYRAQQGKYGTMKYKLIATISGKKTNYTDKNLKQGKTYIYMVYAYKKGKACYSGCASDYTGISCDFDEYQISDAERSTESISLLLHSEMGLRPDAYQIDRRESGTKKYKKLATLKKKVRAITYKDLSVEAGHVYDYRVRSYVKIGKKTYYSNYIYVMKQHASNQTGQFTLLRDQNVSGNPKELVVGLSSQDGNGDVILTGLGYYEIANQDGTWADDSVRITAYRKDQGDWISYVPGTDDPLVIKENETVWIKLTTTAEIDLQTVENRKGYSIVLPCQYNDLASLVHMNMIKNEAYAEVDLESYH